MHAIEFSASTFNMLFQNSNDFVFFMKKENEDYRYVFANDAALEKISHIEIGKTIKEVLSTPLKKIILKHYDLALETNEQQSFQDFTTVGKEVNKFETTVIPIQNENGQFILAQTRPITFNRELDDNYLFMRSIFFKSFLSTIIVSPNFELLEANPRFLKEFGLNLDKLRGKSIFNLGVFSEKSLAKYRHLVDSIHSMDDFYSVEVEFVDPQGETRQFIATTAPMMQDGDVGAVFIILQETTQMVRQAQQIKEYSHSLEMFKRALGSAAEFSVTDRNGRIVDVNERFLMRTGYTREEVIGKTHGIVNSRVHSKEFFDVLWHTISSGEIWSGEICNQNKYGVKYWNDATIIPLMNINGEIDQFLGIYFNVSEKKKIMMKLRNTERIFRIITENTNDLIAIVDDIDVITYASPSYGRLLEMPVERIVGRLYSDFLDPQSREAWKEIRTNRLTQQEDHVELKLCKANGEKVWTEGHFKRVNDDRFEGLSQITMVSRVITERKAREQNLMFLAFHDSLTQLPNRRFLQKEFPRLCNKAMSCYETIGICYIDGDNFKQVNDLYGHDIGDEFIRNVGRILAESLRHEDVVVRMGGDEFVVVLNHLSNNPYEFAQQIDAYFKRLQEDFEQGWETQGIKFTPTISMGVANFPLDARDLDSLIDYADRALVDIKKSNRNAYQIFDANLLAE